jgi:site-specific DNA-adenine methylase
MIKFLPSYVGSKKQWVERLGTLFNGEPIIEYFCGSAVLSANLASNAILNDLDPYIYRILSRFDEQKVPEIFSSHDYYAVRGEPDWWKSVYCLQRMSFSGVFRYSKNGYNVPIKKSKEGEPIEPVDVREEYAKALTRWKELNPVVLNMHYSCIPYEMARHRVAILDPPYDGSQAAYNAMKFQYGAYWNFVDGLKKYAKAIVIFDRLSNLEQHDITPLDTRNMRVAGHYDGDVEAIGVYFAGSWMDNWGTEEKEAKTKRRKAPKKAAPAKDAEPVVVKHEKGRLKSLLSKIDVEPETQESSELVEKPKRKFNYKPAYLKEVTCKKCHANFSYMYKNGKPRSKCDECKGKDK